MAVTLRGNSFTLERALVDPLTDRQDLLGRERRRRRGRHALVGIELCDNLIEAACARIAGRCVVTCFCVSECTAVSAAAVATAARACAGFTDDGLNIARKAL